MWLRCLWAWYLAPSLHSSLATAAPSIRLDIVSLARGAPARRAGGLAGAVSWLVRVPAAAFCRVRRHNPCLPPLQGDGGHSLATPGSCGGIPQAARQHARGLERLRDARSGCLAGRRVGGRRLRTAWGRMGLPDRQLGRDCGDCQALLFPLSGSLPLASRGDGRGRAGPAMEAILPTDLIAKCKKLVSFVNSTTKTHKVLLAAAQQQGNVL